MSESIQNAPLPPVSHFGTGWLAVDKPCGMSVHNDPGEDLCSVVQGHLVRDAAWGRRVGFDARYGVHPVHRLDRQTSGIILLACQPAVFTHFSRQFENHDVVKEYMALVHGAVDGSSGAGHWRWPLTPKAAGRRNPRGSGRRKPCETLYQVIDKSKHYTLLRCRLMTGRTHQIRRHAILAGHPLLGDRRYGSPRACRYLEERHRFKRLALHAAGLTLMPPESGEKQRLSADQLPTEIQQLLDGDR